MRVCQARAARAVPTQLSIALAVAPRHASPAQDAPPPPPPAAAAGRRHSCHLPPQRTDFVAFPCAAPLPQQQQNEYKKAHAPVPGDGGAPRGGARAGGTTGHCAPAARAVHAAPARVSGCGHWEPGQGCVLDGHAGRLKGGGEGRVREGGRCRRRQWPVPWMPPSAAPSARLRRHQAGASQLASPLPAAAGRLVIELFDDIAPVAVMQFRNRCSGGRARAPPGARRASAPGRGARCLQGAPQAVRPTRLLPPLPHVEGASDTFKGTGVHRLVKDMALFAGRSARWAGVGLGRGAVGCGLGEALERTSW